MALVSTAVGREIPMPVCTAQWVMVRRGAGHPGWWRLGLSVDAMFAFTLVALGIGLGWLSRLSPAGLRLWSLGVVLNVLGAGLGRLAESVFELRREAR